MSVHHDMYRRRRLHRKQGHRRRPGRALEQRRLGDRPRTGCRRCHLQFPERRVVPFPGVMHRCGGLHRKHRGQCDPGRALERGGMGNPGHAQSPGDGRWAERRVMSVGHDMHRRRRLHRQCQHRRDTGQHWDRTGWTIQGTPSPTGGTFSSLGTRGAFVPVDWHLHRRWSLQPRSSHRSHLGRAREGRRLGHRPQPQRPRWIGGRAERRFVSLGHLLHGRWGLHESNRAWSDARRTRLIRPAFQQHLQHSPV